MDPTCNPAAIMVAPTSPFTGLSAFPLTPADDQGVVDVEAVGLLIDRLAGSGVDSIGLLGSTGGYAYLERPQRVRTLSAAVEASAGRIPLIVGVGAIRTNWAVELARDAERAGADALLMAPVSYTPLTEDEVQRHYAAVVGSTGLPLCIYNNPGTTRFDFSHDLISRIAAESGTAAVKMPAPRDGEFATDLQRLRAATSATFSVGYSGDWNMTAAMLGGADAFYSALAGTLPKPMVGLMRSLKAKRESEYAAIHRSFAPLWALCRVHGSFRIAYEIARHLRLNVGRPPAPVLPVGAEVAAEVVAALDQLDPALP